MNSIWELGLRFRNIDFAFLKLHEFDGHRIDSDLFRFKGRWLRAELAVQVPDCQARACSSLEGYSGNIERQIVFL